MREFLQYVPYEELRARENCDLVLKGSGEHTPLISLMGVIQGEILELIEDKKESTLRQILKALHRPTHLVVMSLGALVYSGLVQAVQDAKFISVWIEHKK